MEIRNSDKCCFCHTNLQIIEKNFDFPNYVYLILKCKKCGMTYPIFRRLKKDKIIN